MHGEIENGIIVGNWERLKKSWVWKTKRKKSNKDVKIMNEDNYRVKK